MILPKEEQDLFFQNYLPLLCYAGIYEGILPQGATMKDFYYTDTTTKALCRDVLFNDKDTIVFYKKDNKRFLQENSGLEFVNNIQKGVFGKFVFFEEQAHCAIFQSAENSKWYEVIAITQPISSMMNSSPAVIETVIFNFNGKIICDGLIKFHNLQLGPNIMDGVQESYTSNKENCMIIKLIK